jgi:hypothetical protein
MRDILMPLLMTVSVNLALAWTLQGRAEDRPAIEKARRRSGGAAGMTAVAMGRVRDCVTNAQAHDQECASA